MTAGSSIERQVDGSLRRVGLSGCGARVVVGCSGGPDSTALLRSLHRFQAAHQLSLHVAHLNHDFRGAEADHDAAFVQRLADGLAVPCSIDKRDPIAYQRERGVSSFEQAAREMRYSFLAAVSSTVGASAVALGHTADDQAETVLLHILRGAGIQGLRGMVEIGDWPWPSPTPGPLLYRPLLAINKTETAAYCRRLGQTYREDSGNYLWRFTRNRVRLDLMPRLARDYNSRVRDALLRLSRAAADEADFINSELDRRWGSLAKVEDGGVSLEAGALAVLHPALQRRALRRAYALAAGDARALGESHLEAMVSLLDKGRGGRSIDLPRGVRARLEAGVVHVGIHGDAGGVTTPLGEYAVRVPREFGETVEAKVGEWRLLMQVRAPSGLRDGAGFSDQRLGVRLRRDVLGDVVTLRGRRPGDRFQPSGMTGTRKLQDFFTDAKIPRSRRDSIPLLVCERGIAWVVGHRVAGWALADDATDDVWVELVSRP